MLIYYPEAKVVIPSSLSINGSATTWTLDQTGTVAGLSDDIALQLSEIFGVLADSTRLKIIATLMSGEVCVCEIAKRLFLQQSTVSHQLRLLRDLRLVTHRKQGRTVYYQLCDDHVAALLRQALDHVRETSEPPLLVPAVTQDTGLGVTD